MLKSNYILKIIKASTAYLHNRRLYLCFLFVLIFVDFQSFSQIKNPSTPRQQLGISAHIDTLIKLSEKNKRIHPKSSIKYAKEGLILAKQNKDTAKLLNFLDLLTFVQMNTGELKQNMFDIEEFIITAKKFKQKPMIGTALNRRGILFFSLGMYDEALNYLLQSLRINEELSDPSELAKIYNNLGLVYKQYKKFSEAEKYFTLARNLAIKHDDQSRLSYVYNNLGNMYIEMNKAELASTYIYKSLKIKEKLNDQIGIINSYNNLGLIAYQKEDYTKSLFFLNKTIEKESEFGISNTIVQSKITAGEIYLYSGDIKKAETFLNEALKNSKDNGMKMEEKDAVFLILQLQLLKGDKKSARKYSNLFVDLNDTVNSQESTLKTVNLQIIYNTEKSLKDIEIKNKSLAVKEAEIKRQNLWISNLILAGLLLIAIIVMGIWLYFHKSASNRLLTRQKEEISLKNFELDVHRNNLELIVEERTRELIKAKETAEKSDKLKSIFLANLSHEIRTPMNAINGFSHLLNHPDFSVEEQNEFVEIIKQNATNLLVTIDNLVDISKIQTLQLETNLCEFDLLSLLNELKIYIDENYYISERKKNIYFKFFIQEFQSLPIFSDAYHIRQILLNIFDNAFKFTEVGFIRFQIVDEQNSYLFSITDSGSGIEKEISEQIFEAFNETIHDPNTIKRGIGLGLPVSKNLVSMLHGEIWFDTIIGIGTTFFVRLPKTH